ncbi:M16 family metallopeptidase [Streptomyces atratus]|uniref:M16 family metallopeptidase n=1 Tax=Streptomyces TaxID=1883 RepID=UPI003796B698
MKNRGKTGLSHLFEHMMFQGSENVPPGGHAQALENIGGAVNATTGFERTSYFQAFPSQALELTLWLEADRMRSLPAALSQPNLDTQRAVVNNERLQRYMGAPYGASWERLMRQLTWPRTTRRAGGPGAYLAVSERAHQPVRQVLHARVRHPPEAYDDPKLNAGFTRCTSRTRIRRPSARPPDPGPKVRARVVSRSRRPRRVAGPPWPREGAVVPEHEHDAGVTDVLPEAGTQATFGLAGRSSPGAPRVPLPRRPMTTVFMVTCG